MLTAIKKLVVIGLIVVGVLGAFWVANKLNPSLPSCDRFLVYCDAPGWVPGEPYSKDDYLRNISRKNWFQRDPHMESLRVSACIEMYRLTTDVVVEKWGSWDDVPPKKHNKICAKMKQGVAMAIREALRKHGG